jgi:hypothetical protein
MALHFDHSLVKSLNEIDFIEEAEEFPVHQNEESRVFTNSCDIIEKYGSAKHDVVRLINEVYGVHFNLQSWVDDDVHDEVAYFLSEAGSNCLNYSQLKAPEKFKTWFGKKGFVVSIEQKGAGFNPKHVNEEDIKHNEGRAFEFYRNCNSKIFFDNSEDATVVYLQFMF